MSKRIVVASISAVAVLGVLGAGIWWLFNTGRLVYVANPATDSVTAEVCGDAIVTTYNEVSYYSRKEGESDFSYDKEGLARLVETIKAKDGYTSDPTCQTLLFLASVRGDDYAGAKTAYEAVTSLYDQGRYANSNIRANFPLYEYQIRFSTLTGAPVQAELGE